MEREELQRKLDYIKQCLGTESFSEDGAAFWDCAEILIDFDRRKAEKENWEATAAQFCRDSKYWCSQFIEALQEEIRRKVENERLLILNGELIIEAGALKVLVEIRSDKAEALDRIVETARQWKRMYGIEKPWEHWTIMTPQILKAVFECLDSQQEKPCISADSYADPLWPHARANCNVAGCSMCVDPQKPSREARLKTLLKEIRHRHIPSDTEWVARAETEIPELFQERASKEDGEPRWENVLEDGGVFCRFRCDRCNHLSETVCSTEGDDGFYCSRCIGKVSKETKLREMPSFQNNDIQQWGNT